MRYLFALCLLVLTLWFSTAIAQTDTDDFFVRATIFGSDITPPTTPTLLSATPVSATQINLSWTASTDDFLVSGYIVERAVGTTSTSTIATTTLTSYSDTGLTASTSYTYSIRAFDSSFNYSTSSNSISTTTPEAPVIATTTATSSTQTGTVARVVAEEVIITPDVSQASFDISSAHPARFEIRWGRTASYELGFVVSDITQRNYSTIISGLEPGTRYEYEIIGYTPTGRSNVVERGQFRTLDGLDLTSPANVKRFLARSVGDDVALSWGLPDDDDMAFVRIVRSHLGYPNSPTEGAVVYQGLGESAVDAEVLLRYSPAYYTAFVYDQAGNISSGAIAIAFANQQIDSGGSGTTSSGSGVVIPSLEPLATTSQHMPDAFEILIKQANREASFGDEEIILDFEEPFVIYLKASDVTQNLKSIIVQLQDPTDQRQSFSFLLRLNKDQTAYEAVIAPLRVIGKSTIVLSIYDFRELRVAEYRTSLLFEEITELPSQADVKASDNQLLWRFLLSILILLLLVIWWLIAKDRDDDEDNEEEEDSKNKV